MRIKVRNVDPIVVKKIDEFAKVNSLSRSQYCKMLFENLSVNSSSEIKNVDFNLDVERINHLLEKTKHSLIDVEKKQIKLFAMVQLATEIKK